MLYTSIIFDLDGTLLDTLEDLAQTSNAVLARYNFPPHPKDAYRQFVGDGLRVLMERITPYDTEDAMIEQCCALFVELYAKAWRTHCAPYNGIPGMLYSFKENGMKLAVLSNKPHEFTSLFVDEYFQPSTFAIVSGQKDGVPKKPNPTSALEIANSLDVKVQNILFVGDTNVDIATGKAAGMATAGVTWGFRSAQELITADADIIVNNPQELVTYALSAT